MHICPADLQPCAEAECRAEGCRLVARQDTIDAWAMVLAPCDDCGVLVIATSRRVVCAECIVVRGDVTHATLKED